MALFLLDWSVVLLLFLCLFVLFCLSCFQGDSIFENGARSQQVLSGKCPKDQAAPHYLPKFHSRSQKPRSHFQREGGGVCYFKYIDWLVGGDECVGILGGLQRLQTLTVTARTSGSLDGAQLGQTPCFLSHAVLLHQHTLTTPSLNSNKSSL